MNKIIRLTLFCAITFVGLYACGDSSEKTKTLTFGGVSFNYPQSWEIMTENWDITEIKEGSGTVRFIKAKGDGNVIMISASPRHTTNPDAEIGSFLKGTKREDVQFSTKAIKADKFGKYTSRSADYLIINNKGVKVYGTVHVFEANKKVMLIAKQSNSERKLRRKFKDLEASFIVNDD